MTSRLARLFFVLASGGALFLGCSGGGDPGTGPQPAPDPLPTPCPAAVVISQSIDDPVTWSPGRANCAHYHVTGSVTVWKQLSILGTTMGSPEDFASMLALVEASKLKPAISASYPLARIAEAMRSMEAGDQFGKIILQIS